MEIIKEYFQIEKDISQLENERFYLCFRYENVLIIFTLKSLFFDERKEGAVRYSKREN